jgi:hypothetical protein
LRDYLKRRQLMALLEMLVIVISVGSLSLYCTRQSYAQLAVCEFSGCRSEIVHTLTQRRSVIGIKTNKKTNVTAVKRESSS